MIRLLILTLLIFSLTSCFNLPEPHSLKYRNKEFNEIANDILRQNVIYEMDDFTRYYKSINGVSIKLKENEGNQEAQYLERVQDSLRLDPKIVSTLRAQLEETKLRQFEKAGDTILFIVDGFLDDSWGFMYSKNGLKMDSVWFDFNKRTIKFVEEVNRNWKKTAIF